MYFDKSENDKPSKFNMFSPPQNVQVLNFLLEEFNICFLDIFSYFTITL